MTRPSLYCLLLLALLAGCQCSQPPVNETLRAEGEACDNDEQCETSLCDKLPGKSQVCFRRCAAGCRANEICTALQLNDRFVCVPERPGLCQPCSLNIDCAYPGDRCAQVAGATVCTRDCSFDGQCPSSYRCADGLDSQGNAFIKQCQPTSGTCECTVVSANQTRPCAESNSAGTCMGTQTCRPPNGYDTCSAPIPQAELCNGRDDDCNGQIDEGLGMVTCGTGECQRTVSTCLDGGMQSCIPGAPTTEVCDGKDNDCDGTIDNGVDTSSSLQHCGACNMPCTRPNAVPVCSNGACGIGSCLPGFVDLDGNPANGCEYACTVTSSTDTPDLSLVDANCDGIDGEVGNAIFVAPPAAGGSDGNAGTRTAPKATLTAGLAAAVAQNKRDVLVASGTYVEQVAITTAGKGVYGGYTAGTWARSLSTAVTVTGVNSPLRIAGAANATVQLMSFIGANATGAGATAYGAFIVDSPGVTLENVTVSAGSGSAGTNGSTGTTGVSGNPGGQGAPGCEDSGGFCSSCSRPAGGPGGTNLSCFRTGGSGGQPGNGSAAGSPGNPGVGGTPGGPGTPSGFGNWVTPSTYWGANGNSPTTSGTPGTSGANFGALSALGYTRATATNGSSGGHGDGGGGGGGGGGGTSNCNSYGGAGSGGGAGGCGGGGGTAGLSGGASIGVFVWNSTVSATGCAVSSANGGTGGNGGAGGTGGTGGNGGPRNAYGGSGEQDDGSNGGNGGRGGNGAAGGAGGAGGGGPTIGVARGGGGVWSASTTTITTGTAGAGGTSAAGAGAAGLKQNLY